MCGFFFTWGVQDYDQAEIKSVTIIFLPCWLQNFAIFITFDKRLIKMSGTVYNFVISGKNQQARLFIVIVVGIVSDSMVSNLTFTEKRTHCKKIKFSLQFWEDFMQLHKIAILIVANFNVFLFVF